MVSRGMDAPLHGNTHARTHEVTLFEGSKLKVEGCRRHFHSSSADPTGSQKSSLVFEDKGEGNHEKQRRLSNGYLTSYHTPSCVLPFLVFPTI